MARIKFPKTEKDLVQAIDQEMAPAEQESLLHLTSWKIIDAYLMGNRRFRVMDRWSGSVRLAFEDSRGELDFRYEEVLRQYTTEMGRYMKMDMSPFVTRRGESLDSLRKAAIGHATLGYRFAKLDANQLKMNSLIPFLKYGTVGLHHHETGDPTMPDRIEVVHPRELRGFPAYIDGHENIYALARKRYVPLEWLQERVKVLYNKTMSREPETHYGAVETPWGSVPPGQFSFENAGIHGATAARGSSSLGDHPDVFEVGGQTKKSQLQKRGRYYVPLEEIFVLGDSGYYVARFIIKCGDTILWDEDYEKAGKKMVCPLAVARHTDTGRFFARGFVSPLIPFNHEIERLMASLFKNIRELDLYGTLFVPGASGINLKKWARPGPRPRVEKWEPDPLDTSLKPFTLAPHNTGPLPAKIAEFALGIMEKMSNQGPMFQGQSSGRVDSAAGLGFLFNTSNIALGLPTHGLANALSSVYSRMLQVAKYDLKPGGLVEIAVIDDAIAGVVIDPESGRMALEENPIPDPWEVRIDIRDRTPRDREVRKQELLGLYQAQLTDFHQFWITAFEENLDFPGAPKEIWETWRKAIWQIIVLFRDGKTPGELQIGEHTQDAITQLRAVQRFMNKIEFSLASAEVRNVFEEWKQMLETLSGQGYPIGLGGPEDAAQTQLDAQKAAQGGG